MDIELKAYLDEKFEQQEKIAGLHDEVIEAKFTHSMAETRMLIDDLKEGQQRQMDKQDITNGRMLDLEDTTRPFNKKNRKYSFIGFVACMTIIALIVVWGYSNVNAPKTLENITGISTEITE